MDNILQVILHTIRCCFTKQNCMTVIDFNVKFTEKYANQLHGC